MNSKSLRSLFHFFLSSLCRSPPKPGICPLRSFVAGSVYLLTLPVTYELTFCFRQLSEIGEVKRHRRHLPDLYLLQLFSPHRPTYGLSTISESIFVLVEHYCISIGSELLEKCVSHSSDLKEHVSPFRDESCCSIVRVYFFQIRTIVSPRCVYLHECYRVTSSTLCSFVISAPRIALGVPL